MPQEPIDPAGIHWTRVSPSYTKVRLVGWGIGALLTLLALCVPLVLHLTGVWEGFPLWLAIVIPGLMLLIDIIRMVLIPRQVAAIGYAEREDDLLVRHGLMFQKVLVVPYGRMQFIDVAVGPIDRMLGLCKVKLHTAAADATADIPGLPLSEGTRLREALAARGESRLAGL
ncbi:PH domain-containing protein [Paeniglutamicibacter gangotriensis]|uniref:PH domain-containing protein n=1 Tax=Paeniglutamicibacter gangotriensis TaxID=254787 RepID=A0A5B0EKE3_9MICC|nr:PH domain-containing protein [Paeniglutamicibacter gangotriensis]KAA0979487.1 PH domain-containing protein [Paeniglutamicibacter gangotriensis]